MSLRTPAFLRHLSPLLFALALAACGGGDDAPAAGGTNNGGTNNGGGTGATAQITGVAATGAAIAGATVTAVNAQGVSATATTGADGSYSITISEGAPYVLRVNDAAGNPWFSYAPAAGRANLTPLTTLALLQANNNQPLAELVARWNTSQLTSEQVQAAARTLNANLRSVMQANGVDPAQVNVFAQEFSTNHTGLDAVLDAMRVAINCGPVGCTQSITNPNGQVLVSWNANISTTGISVSWSGGAAGGGGTVNVNLGACQATAAAGTWSMVVTTAVSGFGGITIPEICVDGLPAAPASQAEFCGGTLATQGTPQGVTIVGCSYANNVGKISAAISTPIALDYLITYTFVQR